MGRGQRAGERVVDLEHRACVRACNFFTSPVVLAVASCRAAVSFGLLNLGPEQVEYTVRTTCSLFSLFLGALCKVSLIGYILYSRVPKYHVLSLLVILGNVPGYPQSINRAEHTLAWHFDPRMALLA